MREYGRFCMYSYPFDTGCIIEIMARQYHCEIFQKYQLKMKLMFWVFRSYELISGIERGHFDSNIQIREYGRFCMYSYPFDTGCIIEIMARSKLPKNLFLFGSTQFNPLKLKIHFFNAKRELRMKSKLDHKKVEFLKNAQGRKNARAEMRIFFSRINLVTFVKKNKENSLIFLF